MKNQTKKILKEAKKKGYISSRWVKENNMNPSLLCYLAKKDALNRVTSGFYALKNNFDIQNTWAETAVTFPNGIICLLSALQFHELTSQMPKEVFLAVEKTTYIPSRTKFDVKIIKFSGKYFSTAIEVYDIGGIKVKVYSPAKTIIDCFRFRNKIGLDIAVEALKDCIQQKKATIDDLWRMACDLHIIKIMRPYLEMI